MPVFLQISAEESFRRKHEFPLDYLRRCTEAKAGVRRVPGAACIVNDDLAKTKAALLRAVGLVAQAP